MKNHLIMTGKLSLLLFSILFFTGCTSNSGRAIAAVHVVEIREMQFQPAVLNVRKGDTVVFINHDIVEHDVTEESSKAWSSSPLTANSSWRFVAIESADYYCSIHPVMKGKLLVE